jgi:hypothetical protein
MRLRTEPIVIMHDGMRRFVWPCSIPRCCRYCDPDGDVRLLCVAHIAMVPLEMLDILDIADNWEDYERTRAAVVHYVDAADEVING